MEQYGVFLTAMLLRESGNEEEIDVLFETAQGVYEGFLGSSFDDPNRSEHDCLQDYIKTILNDKVQKG